LEIRRLLSLLTVVAALVMGAASVRKIVVSTVAAANPSATTIAADPLITPQETFEYDTNRPGSDYRNFETQADPAICRNECANDATCRAFTYVKPGVQGATARCWLKNAVPGAAGNSCCVSGVKSGSSSGGGLEVNVNRKGGDYRHYDLASNNPNQCRDDCMNDPKCRSFTFLRPSYWGPNAHCFLKDSVPGATQEDCCISGVKSGGGGGGEAGQLVGRWDFVCCSGQYSGWIIFENPNGNRFTGWMYQQDHKIAGEINGSTVTFKRTFSGGSQDYTITLSADRRTLNGSFTGDGAANLTREISATKKQ
jgi:hypothetical protein